MGLKTSEWSVYLIGKQAAFTFKPIHAQKLFKLHKLLFVTLHRLITTLTAHYTNRSSQHTYRTVKADGHLTSHLKLIPNCAVKPEEK